MHDDWAGHFPRSVGPAEITPNEVGPEGVNEGTTDIGWERGAVT